MKYEQSITNGWIWRQKWQCYRENLEDRYTLKRETLESYDKISSGSKIPTKHNG